MNLAVIGTGNIGLVTALCFAQKGHTVFCADIDQQKIETLQKGITPVFEPLLEDLLREQLRKNTIRFTTSTKEAVQEAAAAFITLSAPNAANGLPDVSAIEQFLTLLPELNPNLKKIVIRSTVPPGTNLQLATKFPGLDLIASPEFLREGSAVQDSLRPERILIGSVRTNDVAFFHEIYSSFNLRSEQFVFIDPTSAEIAKYAANIFLASRVSLMNEFARICDLAGADIKKVQHVLSMDSRIGPHFLDAGLGYGGSCFPKDIQAFIRYSENLNEPAAITRAIQDSNVRQLERYHELVLKAFASRKEKKLTIWGVSFKPQTDDLRESVALKLIDKLRTDFQLSIYDPQAGSKVAEQYRHHPSVTVHTSAETALIGSSGLLICTEWEEFKKISLNEIKSLMKDPVIIDGRHIYDDLSHLKSLGFEYFTVGRSR